MYYGKLENRECLKTFVKFALRENGPNPKCKHRKLKIWVYNVEDVITHVGDRDCLRSICETPE